jgi:hypothetical protein
MFRQRVREYQEKLKDSLENDDKEIN